MNKYLFLDDERCPSDVTWVKLPETFDWAIVKNYNEFVAWIKNNGLPEFVTFDHDLAFEHYPFNEINPSLKIPYDTYQEKTGYHCAKWLVEYCINTNQELPQCQVHTMNPIGRTNIINALRDFDRFKSS